MMASDKKTISPPLVTWQNGWMDNSTNELQPDTLSELTHKQLERLSYIDLRLYFLGDIGRQDLMKRFGIAPAMATRDFGLYRDLFPNNISFDGRKKTYVTGSFFKPGFPHIPERVLTALSQGFGDGANPAGEALIRCELPTALNRPNLDVLAPVTRAIHRRQVISLSYHSHTSGLSEREIVPFAMVNDGLRWHARAFDRKSREFRDFVFTRMEGTKVVENSTIERHETMQADDQWNRIVDIDLIPHPAQKSPDIIERDFGMSHGVKHVRVRAANAGYILRHWQVDCSPDRSLTGPEYMLCLKDPLALYGVKNAFLAPGYKRPA